MLVYPVFVAAFATVLAAFAYIRSMFKGHARPNRVTWLMWSIAPFTATAAAISSGVGWAVLPVFMSGFAPFLILTSSFLHKNAYWKLSTLDYACGALSGVAIVLWYITEDPNLAIVFAILSDLIAAVPTLIKAWHNPETESQWPFVVGLFSPMTSFLAVTAWTFSALAFPTYLIAINILLVTLIKGKPFRKLSKNKKRQLTP